MPSLPGFGSPLASSPWPTDHAPSYLLTQRRPAYEVYVPALISTNRYAAFRRAQRPEEQPCGKIPTSAKAVQIGRKGFYGQSCDWPHTRHGPGATCRFSFFGGTFRLSVWTRYTLASSWTPAGKPMVSTATASARRLTWIAPFGATTPCSARWPRNALIVCVR